MAPSIPLPDLADLAGLTRRVMDTAEDAAVLLSRALVTAHRGSAAAAAEDAPRGARARDQLITEIIDAHVALAHRQGQVTAGGVTAVQLTSFWGSAGTLTIPATVLGLAADLVGLAWVQARMVLHVAAVAGEDPGDVDARAAELRQLWGVEDLSEEELDARSAVSRGRSFLGRLSRVPGRLGFLLHLVGLRSVARRVLPIANVPLAAKANERATRELGNRTRARYRLPAGAGT